MAKKITEVQKDPFRFFGSIEPEWRKHETGFEFLIRPYKPSELAVIKAMENEQAQHSLESLRNHAAAKGVDLQKLNSDLQNDETRTEALAKYRELSASHYYSPDLDMIERHEARATEIILRCVSKVRVDGKEADFTQSMAESPEAYNLRMWLAVELLKSSTITESEALGL